jgi:hypothetical protein
VLGSGLSNLQLAVFMGCLVELFFQTDSSEEPEELLFFDFTSVVKKQILSSRASLVKLFSKKKYLVGLQKNLKKSKLNQTCP